MQLVVSALRRSANLGDLVDVAAAVTNLGLSNPLQFRGAIAAASDFPTSAAVQSGWTYRVTSDVTDNDASKTNTGQSFSANDEISWNGTNWTVLGNAVSDAADVSFSPAGSIVATDVQAAIEELDTEKLALTGGTLTGALTVDLGADVVGLTVDGVSGQAANLAECKVDGTTKLLVDADGYIGDGATYLLKGTSNRLDVRNPADDAYVNLRCDYLYCSNVGCDDLCGKAASRALTIGGIGAAYDILAADLVIEAAGAFASASTNQDGGDVIIRPGDHATGGGSPGVIQLQDEDSNEVATFAADGMTGDLVIAHTSSWSPGSSTTIDSSTSYTAADGNSGDTWGLTLTVPSGRTLLLEATWGSLQISGDGLELGFNVDGTDYSTGYHSNSSAEILISHVSQTFTGLSGSVKVYPVYKRTGGTHELDPGGLGVFTLTARLVD